MEIVTAEFENIKYGKIIKISGRDEIKPYLDIIWDILITSYETVGGFKSYANKKSLYRGYKFAFVYMYNNSPAAVAVYRDKIEGNKRVGIGAYKNIPGAVEAAHAFIKHDIKNYKLNYWVEVSGPIETLCKKYNGYPIPNTYVPMILSNSDIQLSDDGLHYERIISDSDDSIEKCMFGFKTKDIYNYIMKDMGNIYDEFRKSVNKINESYNIEKMPLILKKSLFIYELFWQLHFEKGYAEVSDQLYNLLKKVVYIIKKYNSKYTAYLGDVDEIFNCYNIITLHKF